MAVMSMHLDLVDLRLRVCVAEANSLTKGAEASHISLPAASTRVKHLEKSIGTKLFYRNSPGHLRVCANTTTLSEFLPPVLRACLSTHPDVYIVLRERLSNDIIRAVTEGQTDIGIGIPPERTSTEHMFCHSWMNRADQRVDSQGCLLMKVSCM